MKILFVVDGRSPIAVNWIAYFVRQGHEIHLASTFSCRPELDLASLHVVPVAFSKAKGSSMAGVANPNKGLLWGNRLVRFRTAFRQWFGPLTIPRAATHLRNLIDDIQPDLIHAMRIPYEGMLAAFSDPPVPLLVSIWGNDFTLHAPSTPVMRAYTQRTAQRTDALHTDCYRDLHLAVRWGFAEEKPSIVLPGGGGVQMDLFYPPDDLARQDGMPVVINPRGFRAYVRNDTFFQAIPLVIESHPEVRFRCPAMQGDAQAERWVREMGIEHAVELLPQQTRKQMAEGFRQAQIVVSPAIHDGTPNTLLEALASGCFPIVGDIESLREWVTPGKNGMLVDPTSPEDLAAAILTALDQPELRRAAAVYNRNLIAERAEYEEVMRTAEELYRSIYER